MPYIILGPKFNDLQSYYAGAGVEPEYVMAPQLARTYNTYADAQVELKKNDFVLHTNLLPEQTGPATSHADA